MELFKKRSTALIVFVLTVLVFTIIGVNRSMSSLAGSIEDKFYNGVGSETAIDVYLQNRINAAKMISIIADNYPELKTLSGELKEAYNDLAVTESIKEKYVVNQRMQIVFEELYNALIKVDTLTDKHGGDADSYADTMYNTQDKLDRSSYNDEVDKYDSVLSSFPVNLFKALIFTKAPEKFS